MVGQWFIASRWVASTRPGAQAHELDHLVHRHEDRFADVEACAAGVKHGNVGFVLGQHPSNLISQDRVAREVDARFAVTQSGRFSVELPFS